MKKNLGLNTIRCNKKSICSLSLVLMLTMTLITALAQPGLAQVGIPQPEKTVGYISVAPKLVGVGQNATVNLWIYPLPDNYLYQPYFKGFNGITVTFVKPDGTKDTFMPVSGTGQYAPGQTEALGAIYFFYAPDTAGNWSVSFTMPAQNITDKTGTVQYSACTSNTAYFTVQTDPVLAGLLNGYPWSPLPNSNTFWNYPINSNNREWSAISGDWILGGSGYEIALFTAVYGATCRLWQPYGSGPNTAHIVWKQQDRAGGLVGGDYGGHSYNPILTSAGRGAVVMAGKVFDNIPNANKFQCIDLTTGQVLYTMPGQITCGVHLPGNAYAQNKLVDGENNDVVLQSSYGSAYTSYLFQRNGTTWNYYDPFNGALMRSISNCSSAQLVDGTNLAYGAASGNVFAWNLSRVVNNNWPTGIMWTKPLPTSLIAASPSIFAISTGVSTIVLRTTNQYWGYSAKDGTSLWNLTLTYPGVANEAIALYGVDDFIVFNPVAATFYCYSINSGALLWTSPSFADSPWATTWSVYSSQTNDYDNLYLMFPDGTMTALSLATGQEIWRSTANPSTEYVNNVVPTVVGMVMVGGNIYAYAGYSTGYTLNPIPRFAMLVCVNATTGNTIWTLNGGVYPGAAADGYVIGPGIYDGNLYCLGKGPTQTTVTAPLTTVSAGTGVLIQGSVIDKSPASQDYASQVKFANGVPAIADEDMSEWMDYLHMQNATLLNDPPKPDGVPVRLAAVGPNGNVIDIGTVTSDSDGMFKKTWTPSTEGEYKVYATFDGSDSYYGSYAGTALSITEAPAATSSAPVQATTDYTLPIVGTGIAMILAVAIATLLILRKRP